jgi:hypothetical protein
LRITGSPYVDDPQQYYLYIFWLPSSVKVELVLHFDHNDARRHLILLSYLNVERWTTGVALTTRPSTKPVVRYIRMEIMSAVMTGQRRDP